MSSAFKKEFRTTVRLGMPIVGAQMLIVSMSFVDSLVVGRLGPDHLAGLAIAHGLFSFSFIVISGILSALSPMFSTAFGASESGRLGHFLRQGILFSMLVAASLSAGLLFAEPVLLFLGQDPALVPIAVEYLRLVIFAVPAQLAFTVIRNFSEGCGDSVPSIVTVAIAAAINIPLDYALVFGTWGFPSMGVGGAAVATSIVSWLMLVILAGYVSLKSSYREMSLWSGSWLPSWSTIGDFLRLGVPLGGAVAAEVAFFFTATLLMGTIGPAELAAHQVALNAISMVFMIPLGMSFAVGIRIAHYVGSGDRASIRLPWKAGVAFTCMTQAAAAAVFLLFSDSIVGLFGQTGAVAVLGSRLVVIAAFFQFFDGLQVIGIGALRGLKEARYAFWATLVSFWVFGLGVILYFYRQEPPHAAGIWYGFIAGLGVASLLHHLRVWRKTL